MTLFRGYGDDLPLMEWLRGADLAGRGEARRRRRLLGHAARLRRDDPHRHRRASGTCTGSPGATARAVARRRPPGDDRRAALRRRRRDGPTSCRRPRAAEPRRARRSSAASDRAGARPARDLHRQRGVAALDRRASARARASPVQIHLSETEQEVEDCLARTRRAPGRATSTGSGCSARARVLAHGGLARRRRAAS